MLVEEIMTKNTVCYKSDTSLYGAAELMVDTNCGCIHVVDSEKKTEKIFLFNVRETNQAHHDG
jgi:predicted transcriptional regulator